MSSPIWTPAALSSELRRYERAVWRLVEAQHQVSTMKLVDSLGEQDVLENLIERSKPAYPPECGGLHYLFKTPFRYGAPYPKGSRFRGAGMTPGVYYACEAPRTAVAEMAFYRLLFFAESPETPWPTNPAEYTGFSAALRTRRMLDLTSAPIDRDAELWRRAIDYGPCQALADAAREAKAEIIRYGSVRDPAGGACAAALTCAAFAKAEPLDAETWRIGVGESGAYAMRDFPPDRVAFGREAFAADPRIAMAWERG
ncbi:MAG: RES family NAD+ phosphorylase [Hyphomicrobiales bacterium]|nr:RES family NAD+ phosphorylase [Hyphomicrobiales bacterium]